jgi:hypothetical protein
MSQPDASAHDHLEHAREMLWDALQTLEAAQRVMFKAGDDYVSEVWGDGVRAILDLTERITDLSGDLTKVHIEIGKLTRKDRQRGT